MLVSLIFPSIQILQHVTRIAEVLLALQKAGNVSYSGWQVSFDCATYTVVGLGEKEELHLQEESADDRVKELHAYSKRMEQDLHQWENEVKELRSRHYELNYYTTLQLLRLRKELGLVQQTPTKLVDPQILALLESISPKVTSDSVQNVIAGLKQQLLDLRALVVRPFEENAPITLDTAVTDNLEIASSGADRHTATSTGSAAEAPSPSLSSVRRLTTPIKPRLTENDLNDRQKELFTDLVEYKKYSKLLVLKVLEQSPDTANLYDIQDWCDEYEGIYNFEDEEEEIEEGTTASSNELSSESESDEEANVTVFDQPSLSGNLK